MVVKQFLAGRQYAASPSELSLASELEPSELLELSLEVPLDVLLELLLESSVEPALAGSHSTPPWSAKALLADVSGMGVVFTAATNVLGGGHRGAFQHQFTICSAPPQWSQKRTLVLASATTRGQLHMQTCRATAWQKTGDDSRDPGRHLRQQVPLPQDAISCIMSAEGIGSVAGAGLGLSAARRPSGYSTVPVSPRRATALSLRRRS